jgi:hypothetical protein
MYLVYIHPLFEYACEVWDNCGIGYSDKLEKLQLDAARIVTGLPIFPKSEYLYAETGWETLSDRRYRRELQLIAMSSLFHSLTVEGINNELVIESLQKGTIKLSSFRKGYIVVL